MQASAQVRIATAVYLVSVVALRASRSVQDQENPWLTVIEEAIDCRIMVFVSIYLCQFFSTASVESMMVPLWMIGQYRH